MAASETRRRAERAGRHAELAAAWFLRAKGYRILARRFRAPVGEIDIIARKGRALIFVEVKSRADAQDALNAVTPAARRRIERAADAFVAQRRDLAALAFRYDVVGVGAPAWRIAHRIDAWRAGD